MPLRRASPVTRSSLSTGSYREEARFDVVRRFGSQPQASRLPSAGHSGRERRGRWLRAESGGKEFAEIARLKVNAVTVILGYRRFYTEDAPDKYIELGWKRLDQHLALARKYRLRVILQMLAVEGAQFVPSKGEAFDYRIWVQPELQERFLKLWEAIASRYKDERKILGYGIFCEPVVSGTRQQWINLANKAVARIRNVDKNHILFIERLYGEFGTR